MNFLAPRPKYDAIKFPAVGVEHSGTVALEPSFRQYKDYDSGQLATWPDGNPVMQATIVLTIDGTPKALYVKEGSALAHAVRKALSDAGVDQVGPGGTLTVKRVADGEPKRAGLKPPHSYEAQYVPAQAGDDGPPF